MLLVAVLSAGLSLWAEVTPAPATSAVPSTTAPAVSTNVAAKAKLKCEKITLIGSRMPVRVCRSPEEIKQTEVNAKDMTVEMQKINPEQYH
jgi:hypothetical protein